MDIDRSAPVVGSAEIEIAADAETVWEVLTDVNGWPGWNPDVKSVALVGEVAEGAEFRWKTGSGTITSRFERLDRPRLAAWTGRVFGIEAVHVWRLEPRNGGTVVHTEESFGGLIAGLLRRPLRKTLAKALDSGTRALKAEAERRAAERAESAPRYSP
jgi:uncharacterized protein YndB with AHSA1/START domain